MVRVKKGEKGLTIIALDAKLVSYLSIWVDSKSIVWDSSRSIPFYEDSSNIHTKLANLS